MKRFYSNTLPLLLDTDSRHAIKVLRCRENDQIEVIDGNGKLYIAKIFSIGKNEIQLSDITLVNEEKKNIQLLSIAIAPTKNPARIEWFVEKATEIGIKHIYPIITERTEKQSIKIERLQQIIIAATKQSKQLFLPEIHPIQEFKKLVSMTNLPNQKYIAHCEKSISKNLSELFDKQNELLVCIGPEGDFTQNEISYAYEHNFTPVSLGNSILRTETAALHACSIVRVLSGS